MSGTGELQEKPLAVTSIPISISKSPSTACNNVMDTESMLSNEMPLQTIVSPAQSQSTNMLLHSHYGISSCSGKSYIPTSYNSPGCSSERARPRNDQINHSAIGQSLKADAKPTTSSLLSIKKVHLRGGGPKRRRGGSTGGARKRGKADMYDDVDILLSDTKSPIFQEDANIRGILLHPQTKETTIGDEGEIYPFEYMTGEELATTAAAFKEDGAYGRYDIDWLRQALEASALRSAGAFDEHEAEQFTEDWAEEDEEVSNDEEGEEATLKENNEEMKEDNQELENIGETAETTRNPMQVTVEPVEDVDEPMMDVKEQMNHVDDLMQKADSAPKTVDEGVEKTVEEENQQEEGHGFIR